MKVIEIHKYQCPICKNEYVNENDATTCMNSTEKQIIKVGDIVEIKYGFGWFDGDKRWVINPDVDRRKHGFGKDCSMGFYYVVTCIEVINHRIVYHVFTNAMIDKNRHSRGRTYNTNHLKPKPINAPDFVKRDSKKLIGKKSDYLI